MVRGLSGPAFHCLSAQFSPVMARGPSGELIVCLSAQFAPVLARGSSGPAYQCLAALYRVRLERASLSFARPERASLSFAFRPCAFFFVSRHFFSPNLRGRAEKKQNAQRKKKHWLSVPDYLTEK